MYAEIEQSRQDGGADGVVVQEADQQENDEARQRADDGDVVQHEGERAPERGVLAAAEGHGEARREADGGVHERDGHEVARDVALDLLRDVDGLPLVLEARQDLDEAAQERVARRQQEEEQQDRREHRAEERAGADEEAVEQPRALHGDGHDLRPRALRHALGVHHDLLRGFHVVDEGAEALLELRQAVGQLFGPDPGGIGERRRERGGAADEQRDDHEGRDQARDAPRLEKALHRLEHELEDEREHDGNDEVARRMDEGEEQEQEDPAQENGFQLGVGGRGGRGVGGRRLVGRDARLKPGFGVRHGGTRPDVPIISSPLTSVMLVTRDKFHLVPANARRRRRVPWGAQIY